MLDGKVIGQCHAHHRHQEWLKFLRCLDRAYPKDLTLNVVTDNYATHKAPAVRAWLNMVERWFRALTDQAIRGGVILSVPDLKKAIEEYMRAWNEAPRPFVWRATVDEIMKKIDRARQKLEAIKPGCTLPRQRKPKV